MWLKLISFITSNGVNSEEYYFMWFLLKNFLMKQIIIFELTKAKCIRGLEMKY